jgi:hypothetical protein
MSASPSSQVLPALEPQAALQPLDSIVVHIHCAADHTHSLRVWRSTFLLDCHSALTSEMIRWENISLYPHWTVLPPGRPFKFTLYFNGLPKSVTSFDLSEIIPEPNGFYFPNIRRNAQDVYALDYPG